MRKIFIAIIFFIFCFEITYSQSINTLKLDSLFDVLSNKNKAMGSVAIFQKGSQVYTRHFGYSLISGSEKIANSSDTKYQIGSITKMFTAAIIFQLIDEKKISLETKLSKYFPEIGNSNIISIKSLLGHKSGLFAFVNDIENDSFLTVKREKKYLLKSIIAGKPHFKPNTNFSYSNSGYLLLSYIIEKITNQKYNEAVQERICNKINLLNTYSCISINTKINIAIPYSFDEKWNKIKDCYFPNVQGVGDIVSTASDLIIFNEALLGGKLISKQSLKNMKTFSGDQFCLGIMQIPFGFKTAYGHGGDTYGTHSLVSTFEKDSLSIAFIDNGEVMEHNEISFAIAAISFNKKYEIPTFFNFNTKTEELDQYLGDYSSPEFPLKVTITKNKLVLVAQAAGQSSFQLDAIEKNKFEFKAAGIKLEFMPNTKQMILLQAGGKYTLSKK